MSVLRRVLAMRAAHAGWPGPSSPERLEAGPMGGKAASRAPRAHSPPRYALRRTPGASALAREPQPKRCLM